MLSGRGWVAARDLRPRDQIYILNQRGGFGTEGSRELGLVLGWLVGDGTLKAAEAVLSFFGLEKAELAPSFAQAVNAVAAGNERASRSYPVGVGMVAGRDEARVSSVRLARLAEEHGLSRGHKLRVPESVFTGSEEMQRGFLQALFTADGHVSGQREKGLGVRLTSVRRDLLVDVQRLLLNFGIASVIYSNRRPNGARTLPDGCGGTAEYHCQAYHELVIGKASVASFAAEVGFLTTAKQAALTERLAAYQRGPYRETYLATVEAVEPDGEEEVYDLTEPVTHSFVANGIVCHNCGEQGLPSWGVCNLGALNLAAFVRDGQFDYPSLAEHARVAIRFLDDVVDANDYFIEENRVAQLGTRRTGLGTMGLADALLAMEIRYGSEESLPVIERIYQTIRDSAYDMSCDIAAEKGTFANFDKEKYLQGRFIGRLPASIRAKIAEHGIRNAVVLTQAPTGTTSLLAGVSSGIEPVYDFAMLRRDRTGEHVLYHPLYQAWHDAHPGAPTPDWFVKAADLTPEDHVRVQALIQTYTDSSISKTVNAPNEHTVQDVDRLYRMAYDLGCKGVTYYRDGSRDAVLMHLDEKKEAKADGPAVVDEVPQLRPRPHVLTGSTYRAPTPVGTAFVTINSAPNGDISEVFITVGRAGSDVAADAEALGRLISLAFRIPSALSTRSVAEAVIDQLGGIGGSNSLGFGNARVRSLADAVAKVISEHVGLSGAYHASPIHIAVPGDSEAEGSAAEQPLTNGNGHTSVPARTTGDFCPICGQIALVYEEGCRKCYVCGFSSC